MEQSILKCTKKLLGLEPDETSFDLDIITHINSEFSILTDLGVGPQAGFAIESEDETWETYLPDAEDLVKLSKIKTCVYLRTRLLFDPPTQGYLLDATKELLREAEWRLNVNREETVLGLPLAEELIVVDGGNPEVP